VRAYICIRYCNDATNNSDTTTSTTTNRHAKWLFREFNELPHFFEDRLNLSYESADRCVAVFFSLYRGSNSAVRTTYY
jgi:autophagy-related protein 9